MALRIDVTDQNDCRDALALLDISEASLAAKAGVGGGAVRDFEQEAGADERMPCAALPAP
jgi:hypothetical protein